MIIINSYMDNGEEEQIEMRIGLTLYETEIWYKEECILRVNLQPLAIHHISLLDINQDHWDMYGDLFDEIYEHSCETHVSVVSGIDQSMLNYWSIVIEKCRSLAIDDAQTLIEDFTERFALLYEETKGTFCNGVFDKLLECFE